MKVFLPMALFSGLQVAAPEGYPRADDLCRFLGSKLEGCKIETEESTDANEPQAIESVIAPGAQLGGLQTGNEWTDTSRPFGPMESNAGQFLLREANETIAEFLRKGRLE